MTDLNKVKFSTTGVDSRISDLGTTQNLLDLDGLSKDEIESLIEGAEGMLEIMGRNVKKTPALRGKTIVNAFWENSTRTRTSFESAGKMLGADVINFTGSNSSISKGESFLNTLLTLQAMSPDVLVIRHPHSGAPNFVAKKIDIPVINGGDGMHAHPTQALLDLFTIKRSLGKMSGLKVAIIGDLLYSRVARSFVIGLIKMGNSVKVAAPSTLVPKDWINAISLVNNDESHDFQLVNTVENAIDQVDVVMTLRIQKERQIAGHLPNLREYSLRWGLNETRLKLAKPEAIVMHPGPMNEGVEIETEVAHGPQSVIEKQVRNGVAMRMAILYKYCLNPQRMSGAT